MPAAALLLALALSASASADGYTLHEWGVFSVPRNDRWAMRDMRAEWASFPKFFYGSFPRKKLVYRGPVNKPVIIHLSSKDVIHSFNLPNMRIKQDVIPGMSIPLWFVPTVTTEQMRKKPGNDEYVYEIACAQLCGNSHYSMRGFLTIDDQAGFDAWLEEEASYLPTDDEDDFWN